MERWEGAFMVENSQNLDGPRANEEIQIPKRPLSSSVDPAGGSRGHATFRSKVRGQENIQRRI